MADILDKIEHAQKTSKLKEKNKATSKTKTKSKSKQRKKKPKVDITESELKTVLSALEEIDLIISPITTTTQNIIDEYFENKPNMVIENVRDILRLYDLFDEDIPFLKCRTKKTIKEGALTKKPLMDDNMKDKFLTSEVKQIVYKLNPNN